MNDRFWPDDDLWEYDREVNPWSVYTNGDADEDAEAGIRGDDAGFYTDDGD